MKLRLVRFHRDIVKQIMWKESKEVVDIVNLLPDKTVKWYKNSKNLQSDNGSRCCKRLTNEFLLASTRPETD